MKIAEPPRELDHTRLPRHVAVIMDGNGRWAEARGLPRKAGHRAGVQPVHRVVEASAHLGIEVITLYAFSTENWRRPSDEVNAILRLLKQELRRQLQKLVRNNVRFRMIGDRSGLPALLLQEVETVTRRTRENGGLTLNLAVNYGGRQELVAAVQRLAGDVAGGTLQPGEIDQERIESQLYTTDLPDPDLLIRTSGECRLSNFLLWQVAYSELYITSVLWPDFDEHELYRAILSFQQRARRFGGVEGNRVSP